MSVNFPDNPAINDEFQVGNRTWTWNGTTWTGLTVQTNSGKFIASSLPPSSPDQGQGWFDPDSAQLFIYYDNTWIEVGPTLAGVTGATGAPGRFLVSETAPTNPTQGDAWFDATSSRTYIFFDGLWVEVIGATGATGPTGPTGPMGGTAPDVDQTIIAGQVFG